MAFKKYNRYYQSGKRKFGRAKQWYNTPQTPKALAYQAYKGVKYLKGLVNSERLHVDTTYSASGIAQAGAIVHLTAVAQGDTDAGRTGNSILLRQLSYRYLLEISSAVTDNTSVACIIFIDTQQVGDTSPAVTDVLKAAAPQSLLNLNAQGRFKIISRRNFVLTPATGSKPAIEVKGNLNLYKHVKYNGATSTDIQKNGLYVLFIADQATNVPTVTGTFRIGYHDN